MNYLLSVLMNNVFFTELNLKDLEVKPLVFILICIYIYILYISTFIFIQKISDKMTKTKPQRRTPSVYSDEDGDNEVDRN